MNDELYSLAQNKLEKARITLAIDDYDRKALARHKGAVFVCNHLLPGLDEWILLSLLSQHYEGVRIVFPYLNPPPKPLRSLAIRPLRSKLQDRLLQVNFFKKIAKAVKKGDAVGLSIDFSDNPLNYFGKNVLRRQILKQLRKAGQPIVPIHLQVHHRPGGLLRKAIPGLPYPASGAPLRVNVRVGNAIQPDDLALFPKNRIWGKFLQARIFSLGSTFEVQPELFTAKKPEALQPLAEPADPELLASEIAALKPEYKITERGQFDVYVAPFEALPNAMFEIARLRELTFRAAGEGTGKPRDLDEYDLYYLQLVIWDRESKKIAGGYRLGQGDLIFRRFGVNGFYTNSLFKMKPGFYPILQVAVELGRSYITPEYQKHRLPLFLLWKGILHFLLAHPQYRYLYGPVSISKDYSDASKAIIVEFVRRFFFDATLAELVEPRKPFRPRLKSVNAKLLAEQLRGEFDALENLVETIEPAHFKVPVLFRQYLRQNARFIAFNVDPNFADCLDGLMILDIAQLPASTIEVLQQEK
ncbi:MAG: lysophospholipid acyltransferase family protein [Saprospiraceae bacterium]